MMKMKLNKISLGMTASMVILAAAPAVHAQDAALGPYVYDPFQEHVMDPFGNCILTPFSPAGAECPAPLAAAVAPPPPPEPTPVIETLTLEADTNFDFDKAVLRPEGRETLSRLAEDINRVDTVSSVEVVGHTDSIGTEVYNQGLSERRAASVRDYLVEQGVNPELITTRGMGETQPIASNETREGRAQNRRVEITVEAEQRVMRQQ